MSQLIGKLMMIFGVIIAGTGLLLMLADKLPFIGKLPGDITLRRGNFQFYFPISTGILVSVILSVVLWLVSYLSKK